jgi:hypothetical protein
MSFSVRLAIDTGGEYNATIADVGDPTYNMAPMFTKALGESIRELDGRTAADVVKQLEEACYDMDERPSIYEALNPPNGWGSYTGARQFLSRFLGLCRDHPKATVEVR